MVSPTVHGVLKLVTRGYHRAESVGAEHVPDGGVLLVSNHSGGVLSMDAPVIATALWDAMGLDRDVRVLAHDLIMDSPVGDALRSIGFVTASPENAEKSLREGAATIVFPGGEWEASRTWRQANEVDFCGRVGYVRTAIAAGVPIVPVVSIGGQEAQVIISRGEGLARLLGRVGISSKAAPIAIGWPLGLSVGLPQFPLPSKILTQFLEPIDPAEFGDEPDPVAIDAVVRARMQAAVDQMAAARRLPVLG